MRTSFSLLFLAACAAKHANPPPTPPDPSDATPAGMPIQAPVATSIDASGGTIASSDGMLVITVPAGAVTAPTAFSIQPITNTSLAPATAAYRLAPGDITFAQPVTIAFAYASDDDVLPVVQDALGYWHGQLDATVGNGAVAVAVSAFGVAPPAGVSARVAPGDGTAASDWTIDHTIRVLPDPVKVPVMKMQSFTVETCFRVDATTGQILDEDAIMRTCTSFADGAEYAWRLNTSTSGNSNDGTITNGTSTITYTAPNNVPVNRITLKAIVTYKGKSESYSLMIEIVCTGGVLAGTCMPETWTGSSHINGGDGAVYDSTFVFAQDPTTTPPQWIVQSGQVNITQQRPPMNGCTTTIEPHHAIGMHDGTFTVDETDINSPVIRGMGTTVWAAQWTVACPNGTQTMTLPYSIAWWPIPPGSAPAEVAPNGMATFSVTNGADSGTVTIQRSF